MSTLLITHPACLEHDTGEYHPECADRLRSVLQALETEEFAGLHREAAPLASIEQILRAHSMDHVDFVRDNIPSGEGHSHLDPDTVVCEGSWEAALRSAGATVAAVDAVIRGDCRNAFCAVRPPGHHAEHNAVMGFCLFNNVAIGALHAQVSHGLKKIAVLDIDVHHGNGTQDIFFDNPGLFYASTHQQDSFPGTGFAHETGSAGNIVNIPMHAGAGSDAWREAVSIGILPRIADFSPDLIMLSAGFDAHASDPLAHMRLTTQDFHWITVELCKLADSFCQGRLVSVLEGGYDLRALSLSTAAHVRALMGS
ncbi:MAG TPA: histone deacetylase family protein [Rhodospirillaceae bacterium]|nr:histone deacetylase family protein [Rhodospirillaceae bacterium]